MAESRKRYNFAEFVETKRRDGIPVDMPDGSEILIPPKLLWPDAAFDYLRSGDVDQAVAQILGADQAARWVEAGGHFRLLNAIILEQSGADVGESSAS